MRKINEILLISIFILTALLAAVVGLKAYDIYQTNRELAKEQEEREFAEVLARNAEAQNRVAEMETEIQELTKDRRKLAEFIDNIQTQEKIVSDEAYASDDAGSPDGAGTVSGDAGLADGMSDISGNVGLVGGMSGISGNGGFAGGMSAVSENAGISDGKGVVSGNAGFADGAGTVSDNVGLLGTVSGNSGFPGGTVSENAGVSGNTVSGNDYLRDGFQVSGNGTVSENETYVRPEKTLEERRQLRTSMEETLAVNQEDVIRIAESGIDFSGQKIACLGDSITAASNLDSEENYQQYSYPAYLKEALGAEEVYNLGVGGSSVGRYWSDAFVDRYQEIPEDVDIIIVMGGTNDGFCVADKEFGSLKDRAYRTFCGDLDELMRGLRENYPDADIFFATPLPNILQDYLMSERDYLLPQHYFADVILTLAQEYDYEVIDLYNSNLLDSHDADIVAEYMPDGVHGNQDGYRILAEHFAAELVRYYETAEDRERKESISSNTTDEKEEREQISSNTTDGKKEREQISENAPDGR